MDIRKALSAAGIEIKPLMWEYFHPSGQQFVETPFGRFIVEPRGDQFFYRAAFPGPDIVGTEEKCKAAAQADYEQRVFDTLQLRADPWEPV